MRSTHYICETAISLGSSHKPRKDLLSFLSISVFYECVKFHGWDIDIKGDTLVQRIKVKKSNFMFQTPSFLLFLFQFSYNSCTQITLPLAI